ncbi:MAG: hypothetical protein DKM22_04965 [Candidatus Melainabacteria bacterium]|nr:MAG: hypothetical protein DKM22_04965 [Candidatus Melainabacteria bacterium]
MEKQGVLNIFFKSVTIYFQNFTSFFKYMAFPVFGQIAGIVWILAISFCYINYLPELMGKSSIMSNFSVILAVFLLITLPGLFVTLKAFWDYLVAYGAINSMLDGLIKSGRLYDFPAHNEVVTRKSAKFIAIWLLISIMSIIAIIPIFWIFGIIFFIYFILVFQIFIFEPEESVFGCFKRSLEIIKGNWGKTFLLAILIGIFTNWFLPFVVNKTLELLSIIKFLAIPVDGITTLLPIKEINDSLSIQNRLTSLEISTAIVSGFSTFIITGLTLPMRSICWGLWYKNNVVKSSNKKSKKTKGK